MRIGMLSSAFSFIETKLMRDDCERKFLPAAVAKSTSL